MHHAIIFSRNLFFDFFYALFNSKVLCCKNPSITLRTNVFIAFDSRSQWKNGNLKNQQLKGRKRVKNVSWILIGQYCKLPNPHWGRFGVAICVHQRIHQIHVVPFSANDNIDSQKENEIKFEQKEFDKTKKKKYCAIKNESSFFRVLHKKKKKIK